MGNSTYSTLNRNLRAESSGYSTVNSARPESVRAVFKQQVEGKAHKEMKSQGIIVREARDSELHPNSFPIIIALDVTGSMQDIPIHLIKEGLPKMISSIISKGIASPAVLFLAIGDHECDNQPLQVGQFESGDEEMDLWLTRTWIEGHGGGNNGESYGLAHYFAAMHCQTDAWDKRKQKGILITIGDEPNLKSYPARAIQEIMETAQEGKSYTEEELLSMAQEKWDVFHIDVRNGIRNSNWKSLLKERFLPIQHYTHVPDTIAQIVCSTGLCATSAESAIIEEEETTGQVKEKKKPKISL